MADRPVGPTAREPANNVRKGGTIWTYYAHVTGGTGKRRQISKGGFATRREAEAARVAAVSTMTNGPRCVPSD